MAAAPFLDEWLRQLQFWVTKYSLEEMSGTDIQADFRVLPRSWTATEETLCWLSFKITVKDHIGMGNGGLFARDFSLGLDASSVVPRAHGNLSFPVKSLLDDDVRRGSESMETQRFSFLQVAAAQWAITDNARAQEGGILSGGNAGGHRVDEIFRSGHVLRIAAVDIVAGEVRLHTKVSAPAVGARTGRGSIRALTKGNRVWIVEHRKAMVNEGLAAGVGGWISGCGCVVPRLRRNLPCARAAILKGRGI